jgi:hypothetical protein
MMTFNEMKLHNPDDYKEYADLAESIFPEGKNIIGEHYVVSNGVNNWAVLIALGHPSEDRYFATVIETPEGNKIPLDSVKEDLLRWVKKHETPQR